ncbi:MAG: hypothetical protein HZA54_01545 [Planctomycetes bacterium]|nr:hypothetical protein [Planctomycetota bacterium]
MYSQSAPPLTACRIELRSAERASFSEHFLTGSAVAGATTEDAADQAFADAADAIAGRGLQPMQEKIFGAAAARERILAARRAAYVRRQVDAASPFTYVEASSPTGAEFAGLQLWGITPHTPGSMTVCTARRPGAPAGRLWTWGDCRLLHLPFLRGTDADGALPAGGPAQADLMFRNAGNALRAYGFSYAQVIRTWIYLARLLDWYGDFNRVRTAHYQREGLSVETPGQVFPASTGIQGHALGAECFMDLFALDTIGCNHVSVQPLLASARQNRAFRYGSAFSRGMSVTTEGRRTVYVSGTASIDPQGATKHVGDAGAQALETLLSVGALLEEDGGGLADIHAATLYCKTPSVLREVEEAVRLLSLPRLPWVCLLADVCRPELLVELEAVAVI